MAERSPFPGMDPWLERHWRSVHKSFVQHSSDQLSDQLPAGLYATAEQTVYVGLSGCRGAQVHPGLCVVRRVS
jgi:hypothetical protein